MRVSLGRLIVVPLASPETAPWLGGLAGMLAGDDGGTVMPISVLPPRSPEQAVAEAQAAVDRAAQAAAQHGVEARGQVLTGRQVPTAVLDAVDEHDASLVLMGWQGRSTANNVFGELIDSVMGRSTVPLAVVRPSATPVDRVLLPVSDDHLLPGGERGLQLAASLADRLHRATGSGLVVLRGGRADTPLPESVRKLAAPTVRAEGTIAEAAADVARPGDLVVTSVAPTGEGLRNATTHLAWATPSSWQVVAIDVGPPREVDVVSAVAGAGMVIEPVADPQQDAVHVVEVTVAVEGPADDPWTGVENAVRLVGTVTSHTRHVDDDGLLVNRGLVEVVAPNPGTALSAIMLELDDARWGIGPAQISYRLVDGRDPHAG
jgi:nucleotide-binding universal stress UspA family protein